MGESLRVLEVRTTAQCESENEVSCSHCRFFGSISSLFVRHYVPRRSPIRCSPREIVEDPGENLRQEVSHGEEGELFLSDLLPLPSQASRRTFGRQESKGDSDKRRYPGRAY